MSRPSIVRQMLPGGVPTLWCPPLTHFNAEGLDRARIRTHLTHISRHTSGWLVPGSTGEGWQLDEDQIRALLDLVLGVAADVNARVLVGVLRQDAEAARDSIQQTVDWLQSRSGCDDPLQAMAQSHVCGFTVCPSTGADLSQSEILDGLTSVLQLKLPTALYQLPQVTQNEMTPETVATLASQFDNFYLFKDTSGQDRVATSGTDLQDVFLVRGAEGEYARWLKSAGGPYDGFLLSTANVFAARYATMIQQLRQQDTLAAHTTIAPVQEVVAQVFAAAAEVSHGNAFTNANKAIDHVMAWGPEVAASPPPRLCDGHILPSSLLELASQSLTQSGLRPEHGYM